MKVYEILDSENTNVGQIGVLLYYERKKEFIIELNTNIDEWTAPLLFTNLIKRHIYTVPRDLSLLWVKERIIPNTRQNIGQILKNHKLGNYDEMKLLELSGGICSQDSLYVRKIDTLPEFVMARRNNITECITCEDNKLLCFFEDDTVKKVDLEKLKNIDGVLKVLKNRQLYMSCKVGLGGYSVSFGDSIDISSSDLYENGDTMPLSRRDFLSFARNNLLDTSETCQLLECSRQNISYMIRSDQLSPIKESVKGNLFLKGDVVNSSW